MNPFQVLSQLNKEVHEPSRLMILGLLSAVEEADFLFVLRETGLTRGNLSSHMTRLENAGYITVGKQFIGRTPRTVLKLTDSGRQQLEGYLEDMQSVIQAIREQ